MAHTDKKLKARLIIDITYDPNPDLSYKDVEQGLDYIVEHAAGEGLLSINPETTVEEYSHTVDVEEVDA